MKMNGEAILKVYKQNLLVIAGLVWGFAGFNVLKIGVIAYNNYLSVINIIISMVVFLVFQLFIFGRLVKKHTVRITSYEEEKQSFYKFFDRKAFFIMIVMIIFGISLRMSGLCPEIFIAVFYTGLGASLFLAGMLFFVNYIKACMDLSNN